MITSIIESDFIKSPKPDPKNLVRHCHSGIIHGIDGRLVVDVTFAFDVSGSGQVDLVAHENDNFLFGARLLPQVLDDLFSRFKTVPISDGVDQDKGVWVISRQAILHLFHVKFNFWLVKVVQRYWMILNFSEFGLRIEALFFKKVWLLP